MDADKAYLEAIRHGRYSEQVKNLRCKYDHVRIQFEDFITAHYLRPYLEEIIINSTDRAEGLRFYDLGCGTGDGYDLLSKMAVKAPLADFDNRLIQEEMIDYYKGVDLNQALLEEALNIYGHLDHVEFCRGDFSSGLPVELEEEPYDLYFTSYGTFSHCKDEELELLLADIALHAKNGSLVQGDFLGRYSYEWQNLWTHDFAERQFMDYRISYLYEEEDRDRVEISSFPMRLMTPVEIGAVIERAARRAGVGLQVLRYFDRSLFVGRHIETGDYNGNPQPLRLMVSSLFERGLRTYFPDLKVDYRPRRDFPAQNEALENLARCWNDLIDYVTLIMEQQDRGESFLADPPPTGFKPLAKAYRVMRKAIDSGTGFFGDVRADLIEAQLGYALRSLEMAFQRGEGLGHGFVFIIRVVK